MQDGLNANAPSYGLVSGACGYGPLPRGSWPYWMAAAIAASNPLGMASVNKMGCGLCLEIVCNDAVHKTPPLLPTCILDLHLPTHLPSNQRVAMYL